MHSALLSIPRLYCHWHSACMFSFLKGGGGESRLHQAIQCKKDRGDPQLDSKLLTDIAMASLLYPICDDTGGYFK